MFDGISSARIGRFRCHGARPAVVPHHPMRSLPGHPFRGLGSPGRRSARRPVPASC